MKRQAVILVVVVLSVLFIAGQPTVAQDGDENTIVYGAAVIGELTDREFEVEYYFDGKADDIIIIEMSSTEDFSDMRSPAIILLDPDFEILGSQSGYPKARLIIQLPADGQYTIIATRADGRAGDSVGEYRLALRQPATLQDGVLIEETVTNNETDYYLIVNAEDFDLHYEKTSGDFHPTVTLYPLPEADDLQLHHRLATLSGERLARGSIGLADNANEVLIVTITQDQFSFTPGDVAANYTLLLELVK